MDIQAIISYLEDFLIFASSYFCSAYLFVRSLNLKLSGLNRVYLVVLNIVLPNVIIFLRAYSFVYSRVVFLILTAVSLIILNKPKLQTSAFVSVVSIGISYCLEFVSILIVSILFGCLGFTEINSVITLSVVAVQVTAVILLMRIRRFRNGIEFFKDKNNLGVSLFASGFVIFISFLSSSDGYVNDEIIIVLYVCALVSAVGLFLWIRKSITEHYRKRLQAKAEIHHQETLAEKDEYIEQLSNSNEFLSKIVHRDNHLMGSLKYSIERFKACEDEAEKQKIIDEILTLAGEREDLILRKQSATKSLPTTGSAIIDGALGNMYVSAISRGIGFDLVVNNEVHYLTNNIISQTDLETLLCDHIKDAIIAVEAADGVGGKLMVTIGMTDNIYEISIKDNGVDFEPDTLARLGLERTTTHGDNGGSGIGFMTTFETLRKSGASLIISEFESKSPFSKSVTFRFDGMNNYIVRSYRAEEIRKATSREDLMIINN